MTVQKKQIVFICLSLHIMLHLKCSTCIHLILFCVTYIRNTPNIIQTWFFTISKSISTLFLAQHFCTLRVVSVTTGSATLQPTCLTTGYKDSSCPGILGMEYNVQQI